MRRPEVLAALLMWAGATLLVGELASLRRPSLAQRLRPYGRAATASSAMALAVDSWRDVIGPLCRSAGNRIATLVGVNEDVGARLDRLNQRADVTAFRVRQVGAATVALVIAAGLVGAARPPVPIALVLLISAPLLAFLVIEQRLAAASARWQRRVFLELPIVAEQLAMLVNAGYSLASALQRVGTRGDGVCAAELRRVTARIRQGVPEVDALREWAARAQIPALDRIVPVLALNEEATDLGRLLSEEARATRAEVQRELVETMERRAQQVWIPVTVATLVPGVIFLAVPFTEALRVFSGS